MNSLQLHKKIEETKKDISENRINDDLVFSELDLATKFSEATIFFSFFS